MRVLLLVALLASFALSASAQNTVRAIFYSDVNCNTEVARGNYPYGGSTTNGTSTANCAALSGTPFIANTTTFASGTYTAPTSTNGVTTGAYSLFLYSGATATSTNACSGSAVASAAYGVVSGVTTGSLDSCQPVTTISGTNKWYVRVGNSASTVAVSAAVAVFAAIASLATFSF